MKTSCVLFAVYRKTKVFDYVVKEISLIQCSIDKLSSINSSRQFGLGALNGTKLDSGTSPKEGSQDYH